MSNDRDSAEVTPAPDVGPSEASVPLQLPAKQHPKAWRRWRPRCVVGLVGLLVLIGCAPFLLGEIARGRPLPLAGCTGIDASLTIGSMHLSWLQPIELRDCEVRDAAGRTVLTAAQVSFSRSPWQWLRSPTSCGIIRIARPALRVEITAEESNLERMLAGWRSHAAPGRAVEYTIEIEDGSLTVNDEQGRTARLSRLQGQLESSAATPSLHVSARGVVESCEGGHEVQDGRIEVLFEQDSPRVSGKDSSRGSSKAFEDPSAMVMTTASGGRLEVHLEHFPLEAASPVLSRWHPHWSVVGHLDGQVGMDWSGDAADMAVQTKLSGRNISLRLPGMEETDRLRLESLAVSGGIAAHENLLELHNVQMESDLGRASLEGRIDRGGFETASYADMARRLLDRDLHVTLDVDLRALLAGVAKTVRLRDGLELTGGRARLDVQCGPAGGQRHATAKLRVEGLTGQFAGRPVGWQAPIECRLRLIDRKAGPEVEELFCQSHFLEMRAQGSVAQGSLRARLDLARLEQELKQVLDLGAARLSGVAEVRGQWSLADNAGVDLRAGVERLAVTLTDGRAWAEDRLVLDSHLQFDANPGASRMLKAGHIELTAGADQLRVTLREPTPWLGRDTRWPLEGRWTGRLETWLPRVRPFVGLANVACSGALTGETLLNIEASTLFIERAGIELRDLRWRSAACDIAEPALALSTAGKWDWQQGTGTFSRSDLRSHTLVARADALQVERTMDGMTVTGTLGWRGDLSRLSRTVTALRDKPLAGQWLGRVEVKAQGHTSEFHLQTKTVGLLVDPSLTDTDRAQRSSVSAQSTPTRDDVNVEARGVYQRDIDELNLAAVELTSETVRLNGSAQVRAASSTALVAAQGEYTYDLPQVLRWLGQSEGGPLRIEGTGTRPFAFRGTIWPDAAGRQASPSPGNPAFDWTGNASLGWTSASVHGLIVGPGELNGRLEPGRVVFDPVQAAVGEGRLLVQPQVTLRPDGHVLQLGPGRVLDNLHLTPELCQTWMKYVTPLLAEATEAEGTFSLDLAAGEFPLSRLAQGRSAGTLQIAQGAVRPGRVLQAILGALGPLESLLKMPLGRSNATHAPVLLQLPPQAVEYRLENGRVYHRGLVLRIADLELRSQGSVGLDDSLDLIIDLPVHPQWAERVRALQPWRDRALRIPVRGSLGQPQPDPTAMLQLAEQWGAGAAESVLENQLDKTLNRLLPFPKIPSSPPSGQGR